MTSSQQKGLGQKADLDGALQGSAGPFPRMAINDVYTNVDDISVYSRAGLV